jgi:uncharacterized protein YutE (UPF0331/DUF86 family)
MKQLPILRNTILPRLVGIESDLTELRELAQLSFDEFMQTRSYRLVEYHLHRALEGMINIGNHLISRIPGATGASFYKDIAKALAEHKIVSTEFAEKKLMLMFDYRNRVVHFYSEISPEEYYKIVHTNLDDIEEFLRAVKRVVEHPEQFGLTIE